MLVITRSQAQNAKEQGKENKNLESMIHLQKGRKTRKMRKKRNDNSPHDSEFDQSMKKILDSRKDNTKQENVKQKHTQTQENIQCKKVID